MATYGGTKTHNYVFGQLVARACKKRDSLRDLVDVQTLHPAGVSTALNGFRELRGDCVSADDCVRGALSDLGSNTMSIYGAIKHAAFGHFILPLVAWSPDFMKYYGKKRNEIMKDEVFKK